MDLSEQDPYRHIEPEDAFRPERPRRIKSGPIAAVVATVTILAATAVPQMVPPRDNTVRAALPRSTAQVEALGDILPGVPTVDLGAPLGEFDLLELGTWDEMSDGSARFRFRLTPTGPSLNALDGGHTGGFDGQLHFQRRLPAQAVDPSERRMALGGVDVLSEEPMVLVVSDAEAWAAPGVEVYAGVSGTLRGTGDLTGTTLDVRSAPGVFIRRGPFESGQSLDSIDVIFAGLLWFRDADASVLNIPEMGSGSLSVCIVPAR